MTSTDRPTPPSDLDDDLRAFLAALAEEDVETLRLVATYVDELIARAESDLESGSEVDSGRESPTGADEAAVDRRDRSTRHEADGADDRLADAPRPDGVPDDARVSVEEIAGTAYYYFQWREGDEIRSKTVPRDG